MLPPPPWLALLLGIVHPLPNASFDLVVRVSVRLLVPLHGPSHLLVENAGNATQDAILLQNCIDESMHSLVAQTSRCDVAIQFPAAGRFILRLDTTSPLPRGATTVVELFVRPAFEVIVIRPVTRHLCTDMCVCIDIDVCTCI